MNKTLDIVTISWVSVSFRGFWPGWKVHGKPVALWNLNEPVGEYQRGTSLTSLTLTELGLLLPTGDLPVGKVFVLPQCRFSVSTDAETYRVGCRAL